MSLKKFLPLGVVALALAASDASASNPNLVARGGVYATSGYMTIHEPADTSYDAGGFVLDITSNLDGICAGFGYGSHVPGSSQIVTYKLGRRSYIGPNGYSLSVTSSTQYISQLSCYAAAPSPVPGYARVMARGGSTDFGTFIRVNTPADFGADPTTSLALSVASDPNGICHALGYGTHVPGSTRVVAYKAGRRSVIDYYGSRMNVSFEANYISRIDCNVR